MVTTEARAAFGSVSVLPEGFASPDALSSHFEQVAPPAFEDAVSASDLALLSVATDVASGTEPAVRVPALPGDVSAAAIEGASTITCWGGFAGSAPSAVLEPFLAPDSTSTETAGLEAWPGTSRMVTVLEKVCFGVSSGAAATLKTGLSAADSFLEISGKPTDVVVVVVVIVVMVPNVAEEVIRTASECSCSSREPDDVSSSGFGGLPGMTGSDARDAGVDLLRISSCVDAKGRQGTM